MVRQSVLYFVVAIFLSCAEKEIADDKYPDIPIFPVSSSGKYIFEKILYRGSARLGNFVFGTNNDAWPHDSVVLFDLNLDERSVVYFEGSLQYLDEFGEALITYNAGSFLRYKAPNFKKETLTFKKFSGSYDSVRQKNPNQDALKVHATSDTIDRVRLQNFSCITELPDRQHYLLRSEANDVIIHAEGVTIPLGECIHVLGLPYKEYFLERFDEIVLGYSFAGSNHIALGIEKNLMCYYKIVVGQDTLKFKSSSEYFQVYRTQNHKTVLIDGEHDLYEVKLKR